MGTVSLEEYSSSENCSEREASETDTSQSGQIKPKLSWLDVRSWKINVLQLVLNETASWNRPLVIAMLSSLDTKTKAFRDWRDSIL